jgi:hypothetical protein
MQRLRNRIHITPSTLIATLALVFAMTGGAYAAGKYIITSTKQISPKVLKSLKGNAGAKGANGVNGAAGPAGTAGATGPGGAQGTPGGTGQKGEKGEKGDKGDPGTTGFTETLPTGKTEKGDWSMNGNAGIDVSSVSFVIPLESAPVVHYIRTTGKEPFEEAGVEKERVQPACPGSAAEPQAEPGSLCVYASGELGVNKSQPGEIFPRICPLGVKSVENCFFAANAGAGADATGFGLLAYVEGLGLIGGTWAVTAG